MMHYGWWGGWWWIWWVIWILIIIWVFALWMPGGRARVRRMTPTEVLQHRLALLKRDQIPPSQT